MESGVAQPGWGAAREHPHRGVAQWGAGGPRQRYRGGTGRKTVLFSSLARGARARSGAPDPPTSPRAHRISATFLGAPVGARVQSQTETQRSVQEAENPPWCRSGPAERPAIDVRSLPPAGPAICGGANAEAGVDSPIQKVEALVGELGSTIDTVVGICAAPHPIASRSP